MGRAAVLLPLLLACVCAVPARSAPPCPVPGTGQDACHDAAGAPLTGCRGTGQDGETSTGAAWPEPRFRDNGDRTVTDRLTGLSWTSNADPAGGPVTWQEALDRVADMNRRKHLGHGDWRLPNVNELESLTSMRPDLSAWLASRGFDNVRKEYYWTSSSYSSYPACAWSVGMHGGIVTGRDKRDSGYLWPVRSAPPGTIALPATGQVSCRDAAGKIVPCGGTGQDAETRAGISWPAPRFAETGDGTVLDRLTGLVWSGDGRAPGPVECGPGTRKTWQEALDHVACLNAGRYLGKSDWRLPNRKELASLVNRDPADGAGWLNAQGFSDVQPGPYWTSSTYSPTAWNAWGINMRDGAATSFAKKHRLDVWPVRGGR